MSPRPERKARKNHKVLGEFAGNTLYAPSTGYVLKNKPELVEVAVTEVLRRTRNAAIRRSVVLKAARGEMTASVAAQECGVGRSTINSKLRAIEKKVSMQKTALRFGKGLPARKPAAVPAVGGPEATTGGAAQQVNVENAVAAEANAAIVHDAVNDPQLAAMPLNGDPSALVADLQRQLADKDKKIEQLQEELGRKATEITGLRHRLDELEQGPSRVQKE